MNFLSGIYNIMGNTSSEGSSFTTDDSASDSTYRLGTPVRATVPAAANVPTEPPEADLSHLTDEERAHITSVLDRARNLQEREETRVSTLETEFSNYAESVQDRSSTADTVGIVKEKCPICHTTELVPDPQPGSAQEGLACSDCDRLVCLQCGFYAPGLATDTPAKTKPPLERHQSFSQYEEMRAKPDGASNPITPPRSSREDVTLPGKCPTPDQSQRKAEESGQVEVHGKSAISTKISVHLPRQKSIEKEDVKLETTNLPYTRKTASPQERTPPILSGKAATTPPGSLKALETLLKEAEVTRKEAKIKQQEEKDRRSREQVARDTSEHQRYDAEIKRHEYEDDEEDSDVEIQMDEFPFDLNDDQMMRELLEMSQTAERECSAATSLSSMSEDSEREQYLAELNEKTQREPDYQEYLSHETDEEYFEASSPEPELGEIMEEDEEDDYDDEGDSMAMSASNVGPPPAEPRKPRRGQRYEHSGPMETLHEDAAEHEQTQVIKREEIYTRPSAVQRAIERQGINAVQSERTATNTNNRSGDANMSDTHSDTKNEMQYTTPDMVQRAIERQERHWAESSAGNERYQRPTLGTAQTGIKNDDRNNAATDIKNSLTYIQSEPVKRATDKHYGAPQDTHGQRTEIVEAIEVIDARDIYDYQREARVQQNKYSEPGNPKDTKDRLQKCDSPKQNKEDDKYCKSGGDQKVDRRHQEDRTGDRQANGIAKRSATETRQGLGRETEVETTYESRGPDRFGCDNKSDETSERREIDEFGRSITRVGSYERWGSDEFVSDIQNEGIYERRGPDKFGREINTEGTYDRRNLDEFGREIKSEETYDRRESDEFGRHYKREGTYDCPGPDKFGREINTDGSYERRQFDEFGREIKNEETYDRRKLDKFGREIKSKDSDERHEPDEFGREIENERTYEPHGLHGLGHERESEGTTERQGSVKRAIEKFESEAIRQEPVGMTLTESEKGLISAKLSKHSKGFVKRAASVEDDQLGRTLRTDHLRAPKPKRKSISVDAYESLSDSEIKPRKPKRDQSFPLLVIKPSGSDPKLMTTGSSTKENQSVVKSAMQMLLQPADSDEDVEDKYRSVEDLTLLGTEHDPFPQTSSMRLPTPPVQQMQLPPSFSRQQKPSSLIKRRGRNRQVIDIPLSPIWDVEVTSPDDDESDHPAGDFSSPEYADPSLAEESPLEYDEDDDIVVQTSRKNIDVKEMENITEAIEDNSMCISTTDENANIDNLSGYSSRSEERLETLIEEQEEEALEIETKPPVVPLGEIVSREITKSTENFTRDITKRDKKSIPRTDDYLGINVKPKDNPVKPPKPPPPKPLPKPSKKVVKSTTHTKPLQYSETLARLTGDGQEDKIPKNIQPKKEKSTDCDSA